MNQNTNTGFRIGWTANANISLAHTWYGPCLTLLVPKYMVLNAQMRIVASPCWLSELEILWNTLSAAISRSVAIKGHLMLKVALIEAGWRRPALANLFPLVIDLTDAGLAPTANIVGNFD
jgi:hypothetical protein